VDVGDAMIAEELSRLGKLGERAKEMSDKLNELTVEESAAGGLVRVVVGGGGRLQELQIDPRAMRLDSEGLAREIVGAFDAAFDAYQVRTMELVADIAGESNLADIFGPHGDERLTELTQEGLHEAMSDYENVMAQLRSRLR
jgi:DNA-binding protein YbaB